MNRLQLLKGACGETPVPCAAVRTASGAFAVGHRLVADGVSRDDRVAVGGVAADARLTWQDDNRHSAGAYGHLDNRCKALT